MSIEQEKSSAFTSIGCISSSDLSQFGITTNVINNREVDIRSHDKLPSLVKAVSDTNGLLNEFDFASSEKRNKTNIFYGYNEKSKEYILALKLPLELNYSKDVVNTIFLLKTSSGDAMDELIKSLGDNKDDAGKLRESIGDILTSIYPQFDPSSILLNRFVLYNEPFNDMLQEYIRQRKNPNIVRGRFYQHFIVSSPKDIPTIEEPVYTVPKSERLPKPPIAVELNSQPSQKAESTQKERLRPSVLPVETEDEVELEKIAKTVKNHCFYGKFTGPMIVNGIKYIPEGYNSGGNKDYLFHPNKHVFPNIEDFSPQLSPTFNVLDQKPRRRAISLDETGISEFYLSHLYDNFTSPENILVEDIDLRNGIHLTYVEDVNDPNIVNASFIAPVLDADFHGRYHYVSTASFTIPKESFSKLQILLEKNPDNMERFFQLILDGFDNNITRLPRKFGYIIDLRNFLPQQLTISKKISPLKEYVNRKFALHGSYLRDKYNRSGIKVLEFSQGYPQRVNSK